MQKLAAAYETRPSGTLPNRDPGCIRTCVNTQQPGADEWGECLARFGQQGDHPEEERRGGLLTPIDHIVLVHQIGNNQLQQLARALRKHTVTRRKRSLRLPSQSIEGVCILKIFFLSRVDCYVLLECIHHLLSLYLLSAASKEGMLHA